ncbi:carboxypeptidase-like regulatory domain-containing protein [Belliella sp. DSM 107340]|uniref:Carboxypeptidase-like regulatory domain-containing protein n=1 Tax=Belliella calami TaxID=2923436 RepID=A0ABS9UPS3_9BACT|nr:carboxypeptidase-like regulatory domain-containing protein [Belliella calami]MCH7398430.1 carboxypeptidase-like regulatory domain-containing protein [Belliella calami]
MQNFTKRAWLVVFTLFVIVSFSTSTVFAQSTNISGTVTEEGSKETLVGVNIVVKGKVIGTVTDMQGNFNLRVNQAPPLTLIFSMVGFASQEVEITQENVSNLQVSLAEQFMLGQEVVVSASRVEENILKSPVSIEKMDILAIRDTPADNYYKGIANLKGVDVTTSSINFQIINARGFNSTGNTRFVQLTDGMDTQAPALNFPIGNLNGPSELDVESVEFIPGSASALYGPNAFNGILLVNSKSPFEYQGLSAFYKQGVNHINGRAGEPSSPQPMYEGSIRYAKAFNNKIAFKINASYMQAVDWHGTDQTDLSRESQGNLAFNPGANRVHVFGDEVSNNIGLFKNVAGFQQNAQAEGLAAFVPFLPDQVVSRTGYDERHLVDYNASNLKLNGALHYRITDRSELSYTVNYGAGTSVYTGAQRYSLANFSIIQHKLELKGDNYFLRGYTTIENSGDSYIADLTGVAINDRWKNNTQWFSEYGLNYLEALDVAGFNPGAGQAPSPAMMAGAHQFARGAADTGRLLPGTPEFEAAKSSVRSEVIPSGSLFDDQSRMNMLEGQYDFKNEIDFMDLQVGASYRVYDLRSNGTIFADVEGNDITIQEIGAFAQGSKTIFDDKLKLTGSLRYDKNENFQGQLNPRISGVYSQGNSNFRGSYQTGFRNPTTQGQHIDLNVVSARLIGGLPFYRDKYDIFTNAYSLSSVEKYISQVSSGISPVSAEAIDSLVRVTSLPELRPERVQSFEIGYKSLLANNRLMIDIAYYYNIYNDFITQTAIRKAPGPIFFGAEPGSDQEAINAINAPTLLTPVTIPGQENTFQTYTNIVDEEVRAHGAAIGLTYNLPGNFTIGGNYNFNRLISDIGEDFLNDFNTPEHKTNVTFGNRKLTEKIGFGLTYRYQTAFRWESTFAQGDVPEIHTFDAQVSYRLKDLKSIVKLGGSNIFNNRNIQNFGGPTIGAVYYVSITFDELLN